MSVKQAPPLFSFLQGLMAITEATALFRQIITFAKESLALDTSTILLLDEDGQRLTVSDTSGFPASLINTFHLRHGQGIASVVLREKQAATVLDFVTETRFEIPPLVFEQGLRSAIAVPMMIEGEPFGVLVGHCRRQRRFSNDETHLYQFIGNIGAIAIKNIHYLQTIQQASDEWQMTFDAVPDMVALLDDGHHILRANQAMSDRVGLSAEQIIGRRCHEVIHGTDTPPGYCPFTLLQEDGEVHRAEVAEKKLCGQFAVTVAPLFDSNGGRRRGCVHFVRDITDREQIEGELREKKRFLNVIIDTEPECVKLLGADGSLLFINRAGLEMLDAESFEQVKGLSAYPLILPPYRDDFRGITEAAFAGQSGSLEFELVGLKGRRLWLETRVAPLRDGDNTIFAALAITRDITERKGAEAKLAAYQAGLEGLVAQRTAELTAASARLQQELAERVALETALHESERRECQRIGRDLHDGMGQILTGMAFKIGALEAMLRRGGPQEIAVVSELAGLIDQAKGSLRRLLSGFDLTDRRGGGLAEALNQLASRMQSMFAIPCQLKITGHLPPCEEQTVANLMRIVQEAVTNAVKHGEATEVEIGAYRRAKAIVVSIADNGRGLPHRVRQTTTGNGLKIMGHRARLIGAKLTIKPRPGGGTIVRCAVPLP